MGHAIWQYMAVKIRVKLYFANICKFIILSVCSFFLWPTKLDRLNYQVWISHVQISHFFFENLCFGREEKCRDLGAGWMDLWICASLGPYVAWSYHVPQSQPWCDSKFSTSEAINTSLCKEMATINSRYVNNVLYFVDFLICHCFVLCNSTCRKCFLHNINKE